LPAALANNPPIILADEHALPRCGDTREVMAAFLAVSARMERHCFWSRRASRTRRADQIIDMPSSIGAETGKPRRRRSGNDDSDS